MIQSLLLAGLLSQSPADLRRKDGPPSLPKGAQMVLLEGDPSRDGFLAMRLKLPAGFRIPPHTHPGQERLTVLEGTYLIGHGEELDEASMKSWPAGSYVTTERGKAHYVLAKTEVVLQLTTVGPWGIDYLDPRDDPRRKK